MDIKLLEIRDRNTFIPALAVRLRASNADELYLLRRAGYSKDAITGVTEGKALKCPTCGYYLGADLVKTLSRPDVLKCPNSNHDEAIMVEAQGEMTYDGPPYILLTKLEGGRCEYDQYAWADRTMSRAHDWLIRKWSSIKSGDVIDVEYIYGEAPCAKVSERVTCPL